MELTSAAGVELRETAGFPIAQISRALDDTIKPARPRQLVEVLVLFSDHDPHAARAWEREFLSRYISTPHDHVRLLHRLGVPADDVVAVARGTTADLIALAWSQGLSGGNARVVSQTLAHSDFPILSSSRSGERNDR